MNNMEVSIEINDKITKETFILYYIPKRLFDIIGGFIGSVFTLLILIFVKIAYMLDGDFSPVVFKQERIGKNGKLFKLYKFRSMIPNADEELYRLLETNEDIAREYKRYKKLKNDPRITKIGNFLRKTSLDEFPQFFNVLKGNMSLVGPRPYLPREKKDMGEYYDTVIMSKPGLTGYWQVNGRSETDFGERLVLDEYYDKHKGLILDIKILIETVKQIVFKKGM